MSDSQKDQFPPKGRSRETFEGTHFDDRDLQKVHAQLMREKEEPSENFSPMPLFLVALFMVFAFWAGIYLVKYSGDFSPYHYDETKSPGVAKDTGPKEVDMMALGKRIYNQNCVACHQADGNGLAGVYPPLVNSNWVQDDPDRLVNIVLAGMAGPVTVNGKEYNNAMTAFNRLSDQQIAAVLSYIRTDESYNNGSYPVSEERVAKVRSEYGERSETWSQDQLESIYGPVTGEWEPPAEAMSASQPVEEEGADGETGNGEGVENGPQNEEPKEA